LTARLRRQAALRLGSRKRLFQPFEEAGGHVIKPHQDTEGLPRIVIRG
jgi:hypothetical protein